MRRTSSTEKRPASASSSFRLRPLRSSMTRNGWPSGSMLKSRIETMLRMPEACARTALAHEAFAGARDCRIREDDLDRDFVAEQRAAGAIHGAHPAFGERRENLVSPVQDLPRREHGSIEPRLSSEASSCQLPAPSRCVRHHQHPTPPASARPPHRGWSRRSRRLIGPSRDFLERLPTERHDHDTQQVENVHKTAGARQLDELGQPGEPEATT